MRPLGAEGCAVLIDPSGNWYVIAEGGRAHKVVTSWTRENYIRVKVRGEGGRGDDEYGAGTPMRAAVAEHCGKRLIAVVEIRHESELSSTRLRECATKAWRWSAADRQHALARAADLDSIPTTCPAVRRG